MDTKMLNCRCLVRSVIGSALVASLALACTDTPTSTTATATYTVGGAVSGLAGSGLVLRDNGGDDLVVTADGAFAFATKLTGSATYSVTVLTQPSRPAQTCLVTGGSGTIGNGNVTTVAIVCTTNTYTVGGTVSGLAGSGLVLRDNGGDNLAVSANGAFTFATPLNSGTAYSVTFRAQPANPAQTCLVANGSGQVFSANITTVAIGCRTNSPAKGTIEVTAATTGTNGPRIYMVLVNTPFLFNPSVADTAFVHSNGTVWFRVPEGPYSVGLTLPPNCALPAAAHNPVFMRVGTGVPVSASARFSVTCY